MTKVVQQSYVYGPTSTPLLGETIGQNLHRTVTTYPTQEALVAPTQHVRLTYQQLWEQTTIVARALLAKGIRRGDRVGLWAPNRYEWVLVQYAAALIGVIIVSLNPALQFTELLFSINQSEIKTIFSVVKYRENDHCKVIDKIRSKAPSLTDVLYFAHPTWENFLQLAALKEDTVLHHAMRSVQFDDVLCIQYTSGATGEPKGVTLSHHGTLNNAYFTTGRLQYTPVDRVCLPIPLFHTFSMVLGSLGTMTRGATLVLPGEQFQAETVLQTIEAERCTSLLAVPTMYRSLLTRLKVSPHKVSTLRTGIMGGAVCSSAIVKDTIEKLHLKELTICYGMTETSPTATQTVIGTPVEKLCTTVGTVHDHVELKIVDLTTGNIVPRSQEGEICTRGYSVMLKYWDSPEATNAVIDAARWMHTGDKGSMDEEGYLTVTGRIKDIIIRGGENISPMEIEDCINWNDAVAEVHVVGVPDETYGEEVMAWVKLVDGCTVTVEELRTLCKNHIAPYKVPRYWKFVTDEFPAETASAACKAALKELVATKERLSDPSIIDSRKEGTASGKRPREA
ncbi:fatty-acyl-CoA synthase [Angomonas deanei]|nr:fatty-acyl-CoA synthase [Angomonas deanei]|eukprot:EPY15053.1 fatty-acyl-CoA synthase [Angomonas deanei]